MTWWINPQENVVEWDTYHKPHVLWFAWHYDGYSEYSKSNVLMPSIWLEVER